jgi:hypothetical protein
MGEEQTANLEFDVRISLTESIFHDGPVLLGCVYYSGMDFTYARPFFARDLSVKAFHRPSAS